MTRSAEALAALFRDACAIEIAALKPGNVHVHAPGHGMTSVDFLRSAQVAAEPLCRAGASLGARVLAAVTATRAAVGQNTNLGILLLCAPLAMAAQASAALRPALEHVLAEADAEDAAQVFRAIVLAAPGGLGDAPRHDVRGPVTVTLGEAMAAAAAHDTIARQYVTGFADIFDAGVPIYAAALTRGWSAAWAAVAAYLDFLAGIPDTHVRRKHGSDVAERVQAEAVSLQRRLAAASRPDDLAGDLLRWDADLKRRGLNPGTSADLTVATIFACALQDGLRCGAGNA